MHKLCIFLLYLFRSLVPQKLVHFLDSFMLRLICLCHVFYLSSVSSPLSHTLQLYRKQLKPGDAKIIEMVQCEKYLQWLLSRHLHAAVTDADSLWRSLADPSTESDKTIYVLIFFRLYMCYFLNKKGFDLFSNRA